MNLISVNNTHLLLISLLICSALTSTFAASQIKATCGFPGSPKNGRVLHLLEKYEEGMLVTFECDTGYFLLGSMTRTCLANGTWSASMPVCDQSIRTVGLTSASEALNNYPPQLAVDGNFRTCFFSNRRTPRWWRVELPKQALNNQSVISVALTLPPINADLHFSIYVIEMVTSNATGSENSTSQINANSASKYHKCATFRGIFSSKTILVQCAKNAGGLKGNFLQIEDDHLGLEYFGLCEVDIFVERQSYECGQVEVPSYGYVLDRSTNESKVVDYYCHEGHQLVGPRSRICNSKTGQWVGEEPYCERITCSAPLSIANGLYRVYGEHLDVPVVGTRVVYECNPGFNLSTANDTRVCESTGNWAGVQPQCEAIDCGHPESLLVNVEDFMMSGAQFRLLNGSTKYSAIAELACPASEVMRNNLTRASLLFRCREDGIWTEVLHANTSTTTADNDTNSALKLTSCVKQRHNGFLYFYVTNAKGGKLRKSIYSRDGSVSMLQFLAAVVVAAFVSILVLVVLLFKRNIIEMPENFCFSNDRIKDFGQSVKSSVSNLFGTIQESVQSFIGDKIRSRSNSNIEKAPSFTITPSTTDLETGQNSDPPASPLEVSLTTEETKTDVDSALATFYENFFEEITSAAKQVFAEDTDRKLLRAARIAAELDVIKNQQESNYHWIYATPPSRNGGSSSLPPSLTPSVHEYSQIPSSSQIYAKVDLIRKHRYRKEKGEPSVYQIPPRPRHMEIDPNSSLISHSENGSTVYQLRKAISSPEAVFVDGGDYATIRQLRIERLEQANIIAMNETATIVPQQIHPFPIQTLL